MLIQDQESFEDLLHRCREHGSFAFDTEFLREDTYWPELCLIQIGLHGEASAVDPLQRGSTAACWLSSFVTRR